MSRRFTILVADPESASYAAALTAHCARTRPAWDLRFTAEAEEARLFLERARPDAAVLALEFSPGGREGLDLLFQVRRTLPGTPVILVSGACDGRAIRDSFLAETRTEEMETLEVDPEGLLFRDELGGGGDFTPLESAVAGGLFEHGRVRNETAVLVTHGTDTMAWGLAYLRYALKRLTANVAVTGSQVPLEGYFSASDALGNLRTAVDLLNRLRPSRLFAVFNNGKNVFSGRLTKFRKWDVDAFEGKLAASAGADGIRTLRRDWVTLPYEDQRLADLHLLRTGGTIESKREEGAAALSPTGDFVWKYLHEALGRSFERAHRHDLFALDSSNASFEEWAEIARAIEGLGVAVADTSFDLTVRPVFANPLFTTAEYAAQFGACGNGAVFAGYGGGNANVRADSDRSVLPALRQAAAAGKFVAVTSQVPLEPYDVEYETGLKLLEAGGVPCGDLPLADAQVKLSYLLGHREEVARTAAAAGLQEHRVLAAAFLSGVHTRRAHGLDVYTRCCLQRGEEPLRVLPQDPFAGEPFAEALSAVLEPLRR